MTYIKPIIYRILLVLIPKTIFNNNFILKRMYKMPKELFIRWDSGNENKDYNLLNEDYLN
jgi:hypothetical protein